MKKKKKKSKKVDFSAFEDGQDQEGDDAARDPDDIFAADDEEGAARTSSKTGGDGEEAWIGTNRDYTYTEVKMILRLFFRQLGCLCRILVSPCVGITAFYCGNDSSVAENHIDSPVVRDSWNSLSLFLCLPSPDVIAFISRLQDSSPEQPRARWREEALHHCPSLGHA